MKRWTGPAHTGPIRNAPASAIVKSDIAAHARCSLENANETDRLSQSFVVSGLCPQLDRQIQPRRGRPPRSTNAFNHGGQLIRGNRVHDPFQGLETNAPRPDTGGQGFQLAVVTDPLVVLI